VLGLDPGDVYWCTADPGWVTGISYGLSAPLACGVTSVIDDREFDPGRWYQLIESHRVTVWYTAPTALRLLMQAGSAAARAFDLSSLRRIASVGEPLNPEVVRWGREAFDRDILDTWWQTETGAIMIAAPPDEPVVPGSMGRPLPGIEAAIVRRDPIAGVVCLDGPAEGEIALRAGWPSMFRAYLGDAERYARSFSGDLYLSGDRARRDAAGRYWFVCRCDEVIKSAGHLIGAFEVESALLEHPAVGEAAVIGKPAPSIGEMVKAFVTLRPGHAADEATRRSLTAFARKRLGPVLAPREIDFVSSLPKTRSGKILRRLLLARELGLSEGDLSSLAMADDAADSA
jgi:acetyl-CoA synthetase